MVNCKNCNNIIVESDHFCRNCGQKSTAHILTIKELLLSFWTSMFNLDNTLFKTLKYIWAPWKLTRFYVEGKRQSFFNPVRLFLVTLLFHFGYLVSITNVDNNKTKSQDEFYKLERSVLYDKFQSVKNEFSQSNAIKSFSDSVETHLFRNVTLPEKDTLMSENLFGRTYPITRKDAIDMPIDSIYQKYNITTFYEKIAVKQYIRINLDRAGTIKYVLGNAAWGLLFAVLLLGWLFKLLYIRHKKYYVEHLVFWMNVHSFSFIVVTLIVFLARLSLEDEEAMSGLISSILTLFLPIWLYLSMQKYYKQGFLKTILKFGFTAFFYIVIGLLVVLAVSVVSLVFF